MFSKLLLAGNAAIATEHPYASLAGLEVLKSGGNAIDAAVASSFALTVVQHHLGGIGGDLFALIYNKSEDRVYCINASGHAPSTLTIDLIFQKGYKDMPTHGPYAVTIPGLVKGLYRIHEKFGKVKFSQLLSYAIDLAEDGFPLSHGFCRSINAHHNAFPPAAKETFLIQGQVPRPGDILRQQKLGSVLRSIAEHGPEAFYDGWVAEAIHREMSRNGLILDLDDFKSFQPEWCEPLSTPYNGFTIYEVPPNSMGATSLRILKSLEQIQLAKFKPDSAERINVMVKAAEEAYDARDRSLGDPRFIKTDLDMFLSPRPIKELVLEGARFGTTEGDTTYLTVADSEGNIVSLIQSLFHHFGSLIFIEEGGFFLNNRGSGFQLQGPNKLEPGKRPLHTLSVLLISAGDGPRIAMGCSGGSYRPQQHALFVTNLVDYGMNLEDAIDYPRFLWTGGRKLIVEEGYTGIHELNYEVQSVKYPGRTGVAQGIETLEHAKKAVCDIRGDGLPMGF